MKLPGEEESGRGGLPVFYMIVGVTAFMLILLLVILKSNNEQKSTPDRQRGHRTGASKKSSQRINLGPTE